MRGARSVHLTVQKVRHILADLKIVIAAAPQVHVGGIRLHFSPGAVRIPEGGQDQNAGGQVAETLGHGRKSSGHGYM
jgi:hypothetical protein